MTPISKEEFMVILKRQQESGLSVKDYRKALLELGVISGEENELRGLKKITREQLILLLKETKTNESIIVD